MKRLLLPLIAALALPAQAGVDREVHELCLKASDYKGCVEMQKQSDNKKVKSKKTNGVLSIFQLKKEPSKRQLRERCLLGNEAGYVAVIESIDRCVDELSQVGPTVLDIDPLLHKTCPSGMNELGEYLLCITNNSDWEVPEQVANEHRLAKQKSEQATEEAENRLPETVTYKGKTYTASRVCEPGTKMWWQPNFLGTKVKEIGCMTDREGEQYNRDRKIGRTRRNYSTEFRLQQIEGRQRLMQHERHLDKLCGITGDC